VRGGEGLAACDAEGENTAADQTFEDLQVDCNIEIKRRGLVGLCKTVTARKIAIVCDAVRYIYREAKIPVLKWLR